MILEAADYKDFALSVIGAAQKAGAAIMDIYGPNMNVRYKADSSPVTDADHASEDIIIGELSKLMPDVPIVSEEQASAGNLPATAGVYFLVDPLDGTKEFLKLNGEFSINIALVSGERAIFGLLFGPAKADCFVTLSPGKAYRCVLHPARGPQLKDLDFKRLNGETGKRPVTAIVSRSHMRPETVAFLEELGNPERMTMGSALKFGLLAAGEADVYPRHGPTNEWDTAAGQAILEAVGGSVLTLDGEPLRYGKSEQRYGNPPFVAWRRPPNR